MQFNSKREELEYEASGKLFNESNHPIEQNFIEKYNESKISSVWPFIPLLSFEKEAYKQDKVYLFNKPGDDPIEQNESQKFIKGIIFSVFLKEKIIKIIKMERLLWFLLIINCHPMC